MKIIQFIRHAESEANAGLPTNNDASIRLTEKGRKQAIALADSISLKPDLIIHSKYIRTQLTAAPTIQKFPNVCVKILPIHEFTYLSPETCNGTNALQRQDLVSDYWKACSPSYIHGEGSETFSQFITRIDKCLQCLEFCEAQNIIVFTHGHVLRAIWQQLSGRQFSTDTERMHHFHHHMTFLPVPNTCIFKATYEKNLWQIVDPQPLIF